ncbi:EAL domain-containing protein [Paraglaciecola sp. 25GB23A]|uniref:EAL domain-containing protein n=1 Tax=Paraglaciecola sp. 25GB23A TaxID=3156068 RepID=UPI0032AEAA13
MSNKPIKVLLVEKCPVFAKRIRTSLASKQALVFKVVWVREMDEATELLNSKHIDIVLLDLSVSNGKSADFVEQILQQIPHAIIILLCTNLDKVFALQAMSKGASDCLDKSRLGQSWLKRVLAYNLMLARAEKMESISEARLHAIGNASSLGVVVSDLLGNITYTNPAYQAITGFSAEQSLGQHWATSIHANDRLRLEHEWRDELQIQKTFYSDVRLTRHDKSTCRVRMTGTFIKDEQGLYGHVRTLEDLTERYNLSSSTMPLLNPSRTWLPATTAQLTIDVMGDAVLSTDINGKVVYLNQAAERLTGWHNHEAAGCLLATIFNLKDRTTGCTAADSIQFALAENKRIELVRDCVLIRKDGVETMIEESAAPINDKAGQIIGAVLVFRDVTESRVMTIKMTHLAQHDALTGLPNRLLLQERLNQAIRLAKRNDKLLALLYLDIDLFKKINDLHGHEVGDKLLCSIAKRMADTVRDSDTVCRQGGDEFVVLLSEIEHPNDAALLSSKLLASMAIPHLIDGKEIAVGISIGIGIFPNDGEVSQKLMDNADRAMFHAKASGRNCYQFFKESMHRVAKHRTQIETRIKRALLQHEFVLHYQPQFDLASGKITGAEALIRWQDPEFGLLYPAEFIDVAEQSSLIFLIGDWVRWQVCQQQKLWLARGLDIVTVTVNISASEIAQQYFFENIEVGLNDCGLAPWCLGLEVAEKDITVSAYPVIQQLKGLGIKLVLDNFGSGAGHLSYSQYLAFDTIKIAAEIIHAAVMETDSKKIAKALIGVGKNLGQDIIAKGIESQQQLAFLQRSQCTAVQGHYFKHPLASEQFAQLLGYEETPLLVSNLNSG